MIKNFLPLVFLFFVSYTFSQSYIEIDTSDYKQRQELIKKYEKEHKSILKKIKKKHRGKLRTALVKSYEGKQKEFLKNLQKDRIIFDARYTEYCEKILNELAAAHPIIKEQNIQLYVHKDPSINAISIADGIIMVNSGIFSLVEKEGQFVSILLHEIAHEILKHVEENIYRNAVLSTSSSKRRLARDIKRSKYNTYDKSFKIMKNLVYANTKTRRKNELEADSLGYVLYSKTRFSSENYSNALNLLYQFDTIKQPELDSVFYRKIFAIPTLEFNDEWMKRESYRYDYDMFKEKMDQDSLKSHPEILARIDRLKSIFPELKDSTATAQENPPTFKELQLLSRKEIPVNLYHTKEYGRSIYFILRRLQRNLGDEKFLRYWLGKNFLAIYEAKKKYQLNRHLDKIIPKEQSPSYLRFLNFMWNLNLSDYKAIGDHFVASDQ